MGRYGKRGLDFFKKDTAFYDDHAVYDLMDRYGPLGVTVYDCLLTMIYREGYYLGMSAECAAKNIHRKIGGKWASQGDVLEVIYYCATAGLLSRELMQRDVLTSVGIQRRYNEITARNKTDKSRYWILDSARQGKEKENGFSEADIRISAAEIPVSAAGIPISATEIPVSAADIPFSAEEIPQRISKIADLNPQSYEIESEKERKKEQEKEKEQENKEESKAEKTGGRGESRAAVFSEEERKPTRNEECGMRNEGDAEQSVVSPAPEEDRKSMPDETPVKNETECEMKSNKTAEMLTAQLEEEQMVRETLESIENKTTRDLLAQLYININRNEKNAQSGA